MIFKNDLEFFKIKFTFLIELKPTKLKLIF